MKAFLFSFLITATAFAQTSRTENVLSPEILSGQRATFRIQAPNASEVTLLGDWMTPGTRQKLERDDQGVWSVTLGPLEPGVAIYSFTVDGISMADPVNPRVKLRARTSASLIDIPGNPPELWEARDVPHGTIEVNWEKSEITGDTRAYHVYTPPGYSREASTRYPVLYLLHGNNDTAAGWTDVGKANFILDNLIAGNKAVPMIVVMPWGHAVPFGGPQGNNTAMFERYLIEEVIPQVEKKYRVAQGRENRAIVGLSMGGAQALHIGFGHLDLFSVIAGFSSGVSNDFEARFKTVFDDPGGTNARIRLLWIGCGKQDSLFQRTERLAQLLSSRNIRHTYRATDGLHNYGLWRRYLADLAPQIFQGGGQPGSGSGQK